jgi:hypothetical protein
MMSTYVQSRTQYGAMIIHDIVVDLCIITSADSILHCKFDNTYNFIPVLEILSGFASNEQQADAHGTSHVT